MTSDVVNTSTVYYTPYVGYSLPLPYTSGGSGSGGWYAFSQTTLTLSSADNTAGDIYDVFVLPGASNPNITICTGPAWTSATSRGTGTGTTELTQVDGIWVNANDISNCYNGGVSVASFVAKYGVYVGSIYMTAAGETSVQLHPTPVSGGDNNVIGIWNAYNRVRVNASSTDDSSWTYATNSWRPADNSTSNRITWVDGLQQSFPSATYDVVAASNNASGYANVGIGFNSTTGASGAFTGQLAGENIADIHAETSEYPQLGLSYAQALEKVGYGTETFYSGTTLSQLTLHIDM
jgi:hypothetical protein